MHLWIGANDNGKEGTFRLLNGTKFQPNRETLYDWSYNNPNNSDGVQDCVHIFLRESIGLNDMDCGRTKGTEGDGIEFRGLCEIKHYQNCIVKA